MIFRSGVVTNFKAAEKQIMFWRDHLDIAIEQIFAPIKLTRDQHVIARAFGRGHDIKIVQSRGAGKTWLVALCCAACCVLYPGTICAVVSGTAAQATLVLQKLKLLADQNTNLANEISASNARSLVQVAKDKGKCTFKNGSYIESFSIDSMRGNRAKIICLDETALIPQEEQDAVIGPCKNYRRDISFNYKFEDYPSKTVCMTSACPKSNTFFDDFMRVLRNMAMGMPGAFACALDYNAAAANGVTSMDFFMEEKKKMPDATFQMEYGSVFVGADSNSALPFDLTTPCRTLEQIEMEQPKNSKSRYVLCLDIATSQAKGSDNSILAIEKFTERSDGSFAKKLVNIRSYNGKPLDYLAEQVRIYYHIKFPNAEKIIYDARGIGDSFDRFFDKEWVDPVSGKEYPPLVVDDMPLTNPDAQQVLHPFRAVNTLNQRIYTNLRVALEKRTIELPINERIMRAKQQEIDDESKRLRPEEMAVFLEADALQFEMGNIVEKTSASGNKTYDVPRTNQHKDRYSALAMANDYISELEKESVRNNKRGPVCIGITGGFEDARSMRIAKSFGKF
jgi:hypothetical protein